MTIEGTINQLGRYQIRERIGRGGMATVYKGWDTNLDRMVAVKVLHEHLTDDTDFRDRFQREAKLSAALSHPNIVQIYDFDVLTRPDRSIYYMVMTLIDGPTLRTVLESHRIEGKPLTLAEIQAVMEGVCHALTYAQSQGVTHRDVTPANIMYDRQGRVLLTDFGLARMATMSRYTQTGTTFGTPAYMSPEQGTGLEVEARSDIYSLGVVLYEMLSGNIPYESDSAYALVLKHVTDPIPALVPQLPLSTPVRDALNEVLLRALAKHPADRYATAADFLADFEKAIKGELRVTKPAVRSTAPLSMPDNSATMLLPTVKVASPTVPTAVQRPGVLLLLGAIVGVVAIAIVVAVVRPGTVNIAMAAPVAQESVMLLPTTPPSLISMVDSTANINNDFTSPNSINTTWLLGTTDPLLTRALVPGKGLVIVNKHASTATTSVIDPRNAAFSAPVTIASTLTLIDNQQAAATGIIFRFNDEANFYVFALDNVGRVSLWWCDNGKWKELRHMATKWTQTDSAKPAGQPNTLRVFVTNQHITAYVNDQQVIDMAFDQPLALDDGGVGLYLATTTNPFEKNPLAEVDVKTYAVQVVDPVNYDRNAVSGNHASMERF